jgi:hypothetical protein
MQGAQLLRNEAYTRHKAVTKDAAQRRSWGVFATPLFLMISQKIIKGDG